MRHFKFLKCVQYSMLALRAIFRKQRLGRYQYSAYSIILRICGKPKKNLSDIPPAIAYNL